MNISELSIRRPVLATVLTIIILLFGLIGYNTLGVREYPSVDNPIISVTCSYSGANADVIENQITEPLEQNINGIPGIRSLSSVSQQGQCRITVEFELSVDLEPLHPIPQHHVHGVATGGSRGIIPLAGCGTASHGF